MAKANRRSLRRIATRLNGVWPNAHPHRTRQPRGLENVQVSCYRNAVLQMLAHLPKFVNWILQHNEPGQDWPCNKADRNRRLPLGQENDGALLKIAKQEFLVGCVSCRLKAFFRLYWGHTTSDPTRAQLRLRESEEAVLALHKISERWCCTAPYAKPGEVRPPGETPAQCVQRRLGGETSSERNQRHRIAVGQACADEYLNRILEGVSESIEAE